MKRSLAIGPAVLIVAAVLVIRALSSPGAASPAASPAARAHVTAPAPQGTPAAATATATATSTSTSTAARDLAGYTDDELVLVTSIERQLASVDPQRLTGLFALARTGASEPELRAYVRGHLASPLALGGLATRWIDQRFGKSAAAEPVPLGRGGGERRLAGFHAH
jgi:hypothetical protein